MRSAHQNGFEKKKNSKRRCHPLTSLAPRSLISRVHCQSWDRSLACLAALPLRLVVRCKGQKRGALYCMPPADDARGILPVPELSSAGRLALCLAPHCALANVREMRERKKRGKSLTDHRMKRAFALRCVSYLELSGESSSKGDSRILQLLGIRFCRRTMFSACEFMWLWGKAYGPRRE